MVESIEIEFFSPNPVFFPGQTITGQIKVTCKRATTCSAIHVVLNGQSHVQWSEQRSTGTGKNRRTYTEVYRSHEVYYNTEMMVWGNGSRNMELPVGIHVFQFSFIIPMNAPPSFESYIGYIRHVCAVKFTRPEMFKFNKHAVRPFTVIDLYDLNQDQQAKQPILLQHSKTLGVMCCKSGPISFVVNIDRSGFVPGENILINAECNNKSTRKVTKTFATLYQVTTFHARGRRKVMPKKITSILRPEIQAGSDDIWSGVPFTIPPIPPSYLRGCSIIEIHYFLEFSMDPSGLSTDLSVKIPIVIGTIPLQQTFDNFVSQQPPSYEEAASNTATTSSAPMPSAPNEQAFPGIQQYPQMPLPSYGFSTDGPGTVHDYDINGEAPASGTNWSPQYISYNLSGNNQKEAVDQK